MNDLLNAIESCLKNNEFYGALVISFMIPSIAAAASSSNNRDSENGYVDWFNDNVIVEPSSFTGQDCYKLRCKLLHQGVSAPDNRGSYQSPYSNFIFVLPGGPHFSGNQVINTNSGSAVHTLDIDIMDFCNAIVNAGKQWLIDTESDNTIQQRLLTTVQRRPYDLFGNIQGVEAEAIW